MNQFTNRLINETSPYLLQHAHNPVDWYPWGDEALSKAKQQDKPVLVSIGYSACHWCHVMERESFENEETAQVMNDHFICIKIDREERPDIDHIYMDAVQAMTGSGGWPLNVFLLPDGRPFYGGTYFPPVRAFNRISWVEILNSVKDAYRNKKNELESQAENLTEYLKKSNSFIAVGKDETDEIFSEKTVDSIAENLLKNADKTWGGFGQAPKFPQTFSIQFLLRHFHFTKNEASLKQALLSLDKMIYGGINDHLGGGFARYSTDAEWLAPHFEKMLYDNALLIQVLSEAYQLTHKEIYKKTIDQTIGFVKLELMNVEGGFFSALDADIEGVEGKFYTWSKEEIEDILEEDADLFCEFYNVSDIGNWEHTNILRILKSTDEFALAKGINEDQLIVVLEECKTKLFNIRCKRIRPQLDDKIILGWNALMNTACCKAYAATANESYKEMAHKNIHFIESSFANTSDGMFFHTYKNGTAKYPAFLDDYAYLINAYIHLHEVTATGEYLLKAKQLAHLVLENFNEDVSGYFFFTAKDQKDVIIRKKEIHDGAIPSGNAMMAINLHYLSIIFDKSEWTGQAKKMIQNFGNALVKFPTSFGNWNCLLLNFVYGFTEIVLTGNALISALPSLLEEYIPGRLLLAAENSKKEFSLLSGKRFDEGFLIYICKNSVCFDPVKTISESNKLLK